MRSQLRAWMAAGRLQSSALLRQVCSGLLLSVVRSAVKHTNGDRSHTGCGVQVFAQVAKQCLHSPLAERAAGGQCSTSSAFARSAKAQRRPYNFFRDEVPLDPQAQVRLRRLFVGCASQLCYFRGYRDLDACAACVSPLGGVLVLGG